MDRRTQAQRMNDRTWQQRTRTITRDPLFAFLVIGALCFALFEWLDDDREVIAVTGTLKDRLGEDFELLEGRFPTSAEMEGLVRRHVRDEIMFREALDRGMHLDDGRLRQAMVDRMRFLLLDPIEDPDEADLVRFYAQNMERYYSEPRLSFYNLFLSDAPSEPEAMLAALDNGATLLGEDTFWLGGKVSAHPGSVVRTVLGTEIYRALRGMEPGQWAGPLQSPRGYHFVRLDAEHPSQPLAFEDVRRRVADDWRMDRQEAAIDAAVAALRDDYHVRYYD